MFDFGVVVVVFVLTVLIVFGGFSAFKINSVWTTTNSVWTTTNSVWTTTNSVWTTTNSV